MSFQRPKGTEDFYPEDIVIRNKIFDSLRETAKRYGYKEVSTPAFETLSLLTKKEGEEIKEQIFTLEKKGNEEFGLRFDLTVPITRMFIEQQKTLVKPVKWFSLDRMWRYEQPQKGRLREFYQLSVELFGADSIYADAEIISLAIDCLLDLGLTEKDFYLNLNSRILLQVLLLQYVQKEKIEDAIRIIDKKNKIPEAEFINELKKADIAKVGQIKAMLEQDINDIKPINADAEKALEDIKRLLGLIGNKKRYIKFNLSTARGLAYYTGIVFEIYDSENKFRAILGGGRYDNMVEMFGGQKTSATGFGLGYSTLLLLLKEKGLLPKQDGYIDFYVAPVTQKEMIYALKIAEKLRKKYSVETDIMERNLSNQLKYANKIKAKKVIVIGENEIKSGKLTVRDMGSGKEEKVTLNEL